MVGVYLKTYLRVWSACACKCNCTTFSVWPILLCLPLESEILDGERNIQRPSASVLFYIDICCPFFPFVSE